MPTILFVEDEAQIRSSYMEILELEGYIALGAENGSAGLDIIDHTPVDVVVCDLVMPDMDGYEMLRELRQNPTTADMPFILLSARTDPTTKEDFESLAVDAILSKPVRLEELLGTIEEVLDGF